MQAGGPTAEQEGAPRQGGVKSFMVVKRKTYFVKNRSWENRAQRQNEENREKRREDRRRCFKKKR